MKLSLVSYLDPESSLVVSKEEWLKYKGIKNYDILPEGTALMIPANNLEMDAEYYGFWCR